MDQLGSMSNHQYSDDPGTRPTADRRRAATAHAPTPWWPRRPAAVVDAAWFPRLLSWYARTEGTTHWSRRLDADVNGLDESPQQTAAAVVARDYERGGRGRDYYGHEDADVAFLRRRPTSFAVFGKPGLPAGHVAAALSAHWGCVHVSAADCLAAVGGPAAVDLRRGLAVNAAAGSAGRLVRLLGLHSPRVRERGYVLTGLPRHDPELSVYAQLNAVFTANPPDVLIYMSCPDIDLHTYRDGLILESTKHDYLTQTLHLNDQDFRAHNLRYVHWYKSPRNDIVTRLDLENYAMYSLDVVEKIVKRFDPTYVITVDGRRPVTELFKTIKARLLSMPLQRTVVPEIVRDRHHKSSISSEGGRPGHGMDENEELFESESYDTESEVRGDAESETGLHEEGTVTDHDWTTYDTSRKSRVRLLSEFGQLCPVSFSHGSFRLGSDNHCAKFMGKLYYFAGPEEMRSFVEHPRRFLDVPRPGLPVRAIFYGPRLLSGPAAKMVGHFFDCNLIDVDRIRRAHEENVKRTYVSTIVNSVLKTVREGMKTKISETAVMRNAIGDWMRLYFGTGTGSDASNVEYDMSEFEILEDNLNNEMQPNRSAKEKQFIFLKNYFESNGVDFIHDFNACKQAYDEPMNLIKYFQNMPKRNKHISRLKFLKQNKTTPFQLIDVIVETLRTTNKQNKNWIIVNAPLDFLFVKKLNVEALNPIQMVFFCDTDPEHKVLLSGEISDKQYYTVIWETIENVKNRMRHGTIIERTNYPQFVRKIENSSNVISRDQYQFAEDEVDVNELNDEHDNYISHDILMEVILPVITERLNQYTEDLLMQWYILQKQISKEMKSQYIDLNIIECKPDFTPIDAIKILIEDTLYYIKKFLSDNVYDVSTDDDTAPTVGPHDGDTSIYCPVMFANGKLSIGSKKHMVVYQNRYYYMKSDRNFKAFIANPNKYASFTVPPETCPKPKISLYCPLGVDAVDLFKNIMDTFDLTLIDSYEIFKHNVLPNNTPMLGQIYEEPTLREVFDKHFVSENNNKDYVDSLRKYIDKESAHLSDEDWIKMNSVFFRTDIGICYKNYPANLTELAYLKENDMMPDVFIEVIADERMKHEHAKKAVAENWLTYQYAMIENAIARDETTRRNYVAARSAMFKNKLAELKHEKKIDRVKTRLKHLVEIIATETEHGRNAIEQVLCDPSSGPSESSDRNDSALSQLTDSSSRYSELTLKQKKIIIRYGLNVNDFSDLDDFTALERIDETTSDELPGPGWLMSECFSDGPRPSPSNVTVERHVRAERSAWAGMRELAESSGTPWLTVPAAAGDSQAAALERLFEALSDVDSRCGALETARPVDVETAERMLCAGEAHLSRFGRRCPVQTHRHPDSAPRYHADSEDGRAFPAVYRKYVYYMSGPEHRDEFARRPLVYARQPCDVSVLPAALRVAVLGPPRSGKSRCAAELCARHGLRLVRVDEPLVRAYFAECGWTAGAAAAWRRLCGGGALDDVTLNAMVGWATQGAWAATQGFVLDGYPVTEHQFRLLDGSGVLLHRMFVLSDPPDGHGDDEGAGGAVPAALSGREIPNPSRALSSRRRETWMRRAAAAGPWLSDRYGDAVVALDARDRDQGRTMDASMRACVRALREYGTRACAGLPCEVAGLPVPEPERRAKRSTYLDACPACRVDLGLSDCGEHAGHALVQYRRHLYRVCPRHRDAFSADAGRYVDAAPVAPEPAPEPLTAAEAAARRSSCGGDVVNSDDTCLVCALARPWRPRYARGRAAFAVAYAGRTFQFCSAACRREFARRPSAYAAYRGRTRAGHSPLRGPLVGLPVPGYLEQTVGAPVAHALVRLDAARPLYPGLSARATAAVFLGLCVGANGVDRSVNEHCRDAFRRFADVCRRFKSQAFALKSTS